MKVEFFALMLALATVSGPAQAHYLWLEPDDNGARLYFGEADVLLKEKSPGRLDDIKGPRAFAPDAGGKLKPVALDRKADHFALRGSEKNATTVISEESIEVKDLGKSGLGFAKSNYYARTGKAAGETGEPLTLDVKASGADGFTVLYRGQPLPNAKLEVIAPNTWMQEHRTDKQGKVRINTPWRGQYVIHVLHVDKTPGEFAGKHYDNLRNHFTYTFFHSEGNDPGPALPPDHPME